MPRFKGTYPQLQEMLNAAGVRGSWAEKDGKHTFRSVNEAVLNWWPSTGTVQLQGNAAGQAQLRALFDETPPQSNPRPDEPKRQIFIVHGHDSNARDQLELALHRLGLEPFILMNSTGEGKTLIEALEGKIGRDYSADFGIVLMTPDDVGYAAKEGESKAEPRARQNVVLETGMLLSSLTRQRIATIVKGHIELPSDLHGIIRLGYNDHVREIVPKLCQRLKEVGFDLEPGQIAAAAQ